MITDPPQVHGFELRALEESDAPGLLDLFSDPEVCAVMDIEPLWIGPNWARWYGTLVL